MTQDTTPKATPDDAGLVIEPCPCCGAPGYLITDRRAGTFKVKCTGCDLQTKPSLYRTDTIATWNARFERDMPSMTYGAVHTDGSRSGGQPVGTNARSGDAGGELADENELRDWLHNIAEIARTALEPKP